MRKKIYKITMEFLISFAFCVGILHIDAYAKDINDGGMVITASGSYEVSGKIEDTDNNVVVSGGNVTLVLNNLDMSCNWYIEPIHVTGGANVNLVLVGDNSIRGDYGIVVDYGSKLSISGDGNLYVKADSSAGIGGEMWSTYGVGDITINGGKITAISNSGAGIGSGYGNCETAGTGIITINGGDVTGISNNDSAGIGSGAFNDIGGIYISGKAKVYGESLRGGAGIGYGANVRRSNVAYAEFVEDITTDTLKENKIYKNRADLNTLGSISIKDNAKVESYSYTGSGVGLGARNEGESVYSVDINIADNANIKAISYKGEAIGKGAYLDWGSKESLLVSAPQYVKSNLSDENVFAASSAVRHKNSGDEANISIMGSIKLNAASALNKAIDSTEIVSTTGILNLDIQNDASEEIQIVDNNTLDTIDIPAKFKGYATSLVDGEYTGVTASNKTKVSMGELGDSISVNGVTTKNVKVEENTELYNTIYVSEFGNNKNSGLSLYEPVQDFLEAYRRVNKYGTIVVCGGNIRIYSLPSMNKGVTITSYDEVCDYSKYGCYITIGSNLGSIKDTLFIIKSNIKTHSNLEGSSIQLVDCSIMNDIVDTIKLRGYERVKTVGIKDIARPFIN